MNKNIVITIVILVLSAIGVYFGISNFENPSQSFDSIVNQQSPEDDASEITEETDEKPVSGQSPNSNSDEIDRELDNLDSDSDLEIEEDIE